MTFSRRYFERARLYLVLDAQVCSHARLFEILKQSLRAGVDVVQLRDKAGSERDVLAFVRRCVQLVNGRIPLIVNDRLDVALAAGADGVHLGQDDLPLNEARRWTGRRLLIGVSCQTLEHARRAKREGADYIGFGSVFKTLTKPGRRPMDVRLLTRVAREIAVPVFFIGGITEKNLPQLRGLGVKRVAVTRAVCLAKNVVPTIKRLKRLLEE